MNRIPLFDETAPVVCTIGDHEIADRIATLDRLRENLVAIDRTEHGMLLRLPPHDDVVADVQAFVVDEKRCCQFWGFDATQVDSEVHLRWDGPPTAGALVDAFLAFFRGETDIDAVAALL